MAIDEFDTQTMETIASTRLSMNGYPLKGSDALPVRPERVEGRMETFSVRTKSD
jgi:hypothetical protein